MSEALWTPRSREKLSWGRPSVGPLIDPRPLHPGKLHSVYSDEFDQADLDGRWATQGSIPGALAISGHSWAQAQFDNSNQYVYLPAPSGDFTLSGAMQIQGAGNNSQMAGLCALDNSGNGIAVMAYDNADRLYLINVTAGAYGGTFTWIGSDPGTPWQITGLPGHYRLVKSGTSYVGYFSDRLNKVWNGPSDPVTGPSTVTRIGFGKFFGSTATTIQFDWIDVEM